MANGTPEPFIEDAEKEDILTFAKFGLDWHKTANAEFGIDFTTYQAFDYSSPIKHWAVLPVSS